MKGSATERLATELMKLSDDEWACVVARRSAGQAQDAALGQAWEEISERLAPRELRPAAVADQAPNESDAPPSATVKLRNRT